MRSLWADQEKIESLITAEKKILLLLDFDGTLSPLARNPEEVRLPRVVRRLLLQLISSPSARVAVISGRSLPNLKNLVGIESLFYGGNHGLEIIGPGVHRVQPEAVSFLPVIRSLAGKLSEEMAGTSGAFLDNKGLTLTLHYRRVPAAQRPAFQKIIRRWRNRTRNLPVRWFEGRLAWELLPRVDWNKGRAALYLGRHLHQPFPIAVGDDRTDEDMFHSVRKRGISIRIGRRDSSSAQYFLRGQKEVPRFLEWLVHLLQGSLS